MVLGPAYFTHLVLIKKSKHWSKKVLDYKNEKVLKNYITKSDIITAGEEYVKRSQFYRSEKLEREVLRVSHLYFQDIFISRQKKEHTFLIFGLHWLQKFDYRIVVRGNMQVIIKV